MDDQTYISEYKELIRKAELLKTMSLSMHSRDWNTELDRSYCDVLAEIQQDFDRLRARAAVLPDPQMVRAIPQLDQATPTLDQATPQLDQASPLDQATPQLDQATPLLDQATPQLDHATPQLDQATPQLDQSNPQLDQATPQVDQASPQLDQATPQLDQLGPVRSPLQPYQAPLPGQLSPAVPADEVVMRQRGGRHLQATTSPDIDLKNFSISSTVRTPPKVTPSHLFPQKVKVNLNSPQHSHREEPDISSPEKFKNTSPVNGTPTKRPDLEKVADFKGPIEVGLKCLSPTQLTNLIKTITVKHPEIEKEIRMKMPKPDLAPLEERLHYLKSNIFRSLPTSRFTSKTGSTAYSRVATHLEAFKKCVIDQGKTLVESQHWDSVIEYVFLAWSYVKATPVWKNQSHNATRKQCFAALFKFYTSALKNGSFDSETLVNFHDKLQGISADAEEVRSFLKLVQNLVQYFEQNI